MDGSVRIWDPNSGQLAGVQPLLGHTKWVTCLVWQPLHLWQKRRPANCICIERQYHPSMARKYGKSQLRFFPDTRRLSAAFAGAVLDSYTARPMIKTVRIWNTDDGNTSPHTKRAFALGQPPSTINRLCFTFWLL